MNSTDIAAESVITESSTVRMRRDVLNELVEKTQSLKAPVFPHESQRSQLDNRTRQVWHSRLGAWLREHLALASQSLADRALDRKGKAAFRRTLEARQRSLREARSAGERALEAVIADARESHATAAQHCNTSHAFVLQRLTGDAQRLGRIVNKKLRTGRLNHTEATLVDEEYFMTDAWLAHLEF